MQGLSKETENWTIKQPNSTKEKPRIYVIKRNSKKLYDQVSESSKVIPLNFEVYLKVMIKKLIGIRKNWV